MRIFRKLRHSGLWVDDGDRSLVTTYNARTHTQADKSRRIGAFQENKSTNKGKEYKVVFRSPKKSDLQAGRGQMPVDIKWYR